MCEVDVASSEMPSPSCRVLMAIKRSPTKASAMDSSSKWLRTREETNLKFCPIASKRGRAGSEGCGLGGAPGKMEKALLKRPELVEEVRVSKVGSKRDART